jgi:hypothetical protein
MRWTKFGLAALVGGTLLSATLAANAAPSLSNSLTGFTGDSTQGGTQGALASAGLSVFDSAGNPAAVSYDAGGAHFGSLSTGDSGRNYMRTVASDYATASFVAEMTFTASTNDQAIFIGLGSGDTALYGTPDWSTQLSSASFWPEVNNAKFVRFRTANDVNSFGDTGVATLTPGTHRFRMTFNSSNNQLLAEVDTHYAGGPFVADPSVSNFPIVLSSLFAADGWPTEPSRIFFGGDDGAVFRDLSITVVPEPAAASLVALAALAIGGSIRRRK